VAVVLASSAISLIFGARFQGQGSIFGLSHGLLLQIVAATLAWITVAVLFVKNWLKRRKRKRTRAAQVDGSLEAAAPDPAASGTASPDVPAAGQKPGAATAAKELPQGSRRGNDPGYLPAEPASVKTVFVLGLLGGLDELAYFPTLLLGGMFTTFELLVGAVLATVGIVAVLIVALKRFRPLLEFFDRIPLWAFVASFASIMTVEIFVDFNETPPLTA